MSIKKIILLPLLLLGVVVSVFADGTKEDVEKDYKYNFGASLQIKLAKGLKLNLEPEFRFYEGLDKINFNAGLSYKTFGCIYWGATYRLVAEREENSTTSSSYMTYGFGSNNYDLKAYHRYAFDVTYKDKFGRFTPSLRMRYVNYADEEIDDKAFLRYRAKCEYNIKNCKITPFVYTEAYQSLEENMLYKMRYSTGIDLKVNKYSSFSCAYKFDFYMLKYKNVNTFSVGYNHKL